MTFFYAQYHSGDSRRERIASNCTQFHIGQLHHVNPVHYLCSAAFEIIFVFAKKTLLAIMSIFEGL